MNRSMNTFCPPHPEQNESLKKVEDIRALREKMKEVAEETKGKEESYKQLVSDGKGFRIPNC